ncbi:MAG: tetratricopeptide repeat protein [Steroidobacteraceae bacterium]
MLGRRFSILTIALTLGACALPQPYQMPPQSPPAPAPGSGPVVTQPAPSEIPPEETPLPPPAPVIREPTLTSASRALVAQAQSQAAAKNFPLAAASIERALRIEPDNPLLWIELAKVRQAEGNYVQAENMARKALSMSINAPRAQSTAWRLISDSYRARGKNVEAREAQTRADTLSR